MKTVCAWCNKVLSQDQADDGIISHGICTDCNDNLRFQFGVPITTYLDSFALPVVLVDGAARAIFANGPAHALVGESPADITPVRLGTVFECAHARLPEGCGKTIHCSGCTIRYAVADTFRTGRPHRNVPAALCRRGEVGEMQIDLRISTEKVGDVVQLTVELADHPE